MNDVFTFMMLLGTNNIRGIISSLNDDTYTISCDYVSGCNISGYSYNLTSMTDTISGKIEANNSNIIECNKFRLKAYHLTVRDLDGLMVKSENITFSDSLCPTTTGQDFNINFVTVVMKTNTYIAATTITSEGPSGSGGPSLSGGVVAAIAVVVLAAVVLLVIIIITICFIRLGEVLVRVSIFYLVNNVMLAILSGYSHCCGTISKSQQ